VKTIHLLCTGNKDFVKYQAQGGVYPQPPSLLTPLASKRRVHFHCKMCQFGKPIYADYFLEALYGLAPNSFVREPLHNSSRTGHLT